MASQSPLSHHIPISDKTYFLPLATLDLSIRLFNIFRRAGISTVGQVLEMGREAFERLKLGERSIQEVVRQVQALDVLDPASQGFTEEPQEATPAMLDSALPLENGWGVWSVSLTPPLGCNPDIWYFAEKDRAQWSLAYEYGNFPFTSGTIVSYQGAAYALLGVGTNTLKVRELAEEDLHLSEEELREALTNADYVDEMHSAGRRDNRRRPGRGKLRGAVSSAPIAKAPHVCYKVRFALLPDILRTALPHFAHHYYVQPFQLNAVGELVEWRPGQEKTDAGSYPDHFRVATTPAELNDADILKVERTSVASCTLQSPGGETSLDLSDDTEQRLRALAEALTNPAMPAFQIRVAPAYFLAGPADLRDKSLQQMIAPGVSFPYAMQLPDGAFPKRVSLEPGQQVAIPQPIARTRVEELKLSEKTVRQLKKVKVTTLGDLLELEYECLAELLSARSLWELSATLFAQKALPICSRPFSAQGIETESAQEGDDDEATLKTIMPPASGIVAAELLDSADLGRPAHEKVYLQLTGTTYDDEKLGQLSLVYISPFVDRFDGGRSGWVDTMWLTQEQIDQSMPWERGFEHLDSLEARMRVSEHAFACGATPPEIKPADEGAKERDRKLQILEAKYNLVPLKDSTKSNRDPHKSNEENEVPLELYISNQDMAEAKAKGESQTGMVRRVVERYMGHPAAQPLGMCLSHRQLDDIHYWMGQDQQKRRELLSRTELKLPNRGALVMHPDYTYHLQQVQDSKTGELRIENVPEQTGYRVIIGVLARTRLPDELIVHPRQGKPVSPPPARPILSCRTPNYVLIEGRARVA